jgi:hypothetical protein
VKRSKTIQLILLGTATGAAFVGCDSGHDVSRARLSADNTYTNNHYVHGAGYYHAPYRAWYPYPYNSFRPGQGYYHGGQWSADPGIASIDASRPASAAVKSAQSQHDTARAATRRSGFGGSSRSVYS